MDTFQSSHELVPIDDIESSGSSLDEITIPSNSGNNKCLTFRFEDNRQHQSTIVWKGLSKTIELGDDSNMKKQILKNVSGTAKPGEMVALMGPSGSGKTTLLNILGGRNLASVTGEVLINYFKFKKSMKRSIAYVLQEDIFFLNLTVKQHLHFTANLRLPDVATKQEKTELVNHTIDLLKIRKCADYPILYLSGGEKKRCNIGGELLTNPSLLLLDEPTSGLDSTAAHSLVLTLRELAEEKMTVITSIHQPNSKVFHAFDKLILLVEGQVVYYGAPSNCLKHFAAVGYEAPSEFNPADYIMDLIQGSAGGPSSQSLVDVWDNNPVNKEIELIQDEQEECKDLEGFDEETQGKRFLTSYYMQFTTLFERAFVNSKTNMVTGLMLFQTVVLAVICGFAWFRMPYDENRITDRGGFIFFFMTYWFFITLTQGLVFFIPERVVIEKERSSGAYRLSAYFLSKLLAELPMRVLMPFLFLAISYPLANLNPRPEIFFAIVGTLLLSSLAGESIGLFVGTMTMEVAVIGTLLGMTMMLGGGYFIRKMPDFIVWVRYLSPFKYSYDACIKLEFNRDIPCENGEYLVQCLTANKVSGSVGSDYLGVTESVEFNIGMLLLITFLFRVLAYLALRYMPHNNGRK